MYKKKKPYDKATSPSRITLVQNCLNKINRGPLKLAMMKEHGCPLWPLVTLSKGQHLLSIQHWPIKKCSLIENLSIRNANLLYFIEDILT